MPVDVRVGERVDDPGSKILRHEPHITAFQKYDEEQKKKATKK